MDRACKSNKNEDKSDFRTRKPDGILRIPSIESVQFFLEVYYLGVFVDIEGSATDTCVVYVNQLTPMRTAKSFNTTSRLRG